jgi:two-component system, OmpR family, sensor histidine kinase ChvG
MTRGERPAQRWLARLAGELGRIRYRLLAVNLFLVLVPAAGLEFARTYERQLLDALERDMKNQAVLVRSVVESSLLRGNALDAPEHQRILTDAARATRTRIRLIHPSSGVVVDSHRDGPPEGREPEPPALAPRVGVMAKIRSLFGAYDVSRVASRTREGPEIQQIELRYEVRRALAGERSVATRIARSGVFLFLAEPIGGAGQRAGAVYVTRSTNPVLVELHRIRQGLFTVLGAAVGFGVLLTLLLAFTISRPIERLAGAARRIAGGDAGVSLPAGGAGEIGELARAFAEMTEKLEARHRYISEFAADVAHEFKSPLTSIRGAAELLSEGAADDPEARRRFLQNIELDAARLDRLVSRLLELSRVEASEELPQLIDARTLIERALSRCQTPEGAVQLEYAASRRMLRARERDLETALLNLLDNALRFSPASEPVMVQVSEQEPDQLVICVADRGPGIEPANLTRVFDRFFTTDADRDGTGLGLAIVKAVATAHGGTVSVESTPGQGARFRLVVPFGRRGRCG